MMAKLYKKMYLLLKFALILYKTQTGSLKSKKYCPS